MGVAKVIKEIIMELTIEIAEKHSKINELHKKVEELQSENRKLQSELNFRKNTIEL